MRERIPCVYILVTGYYGTLYTGVTSNLVGRMIQHRERAFSGYTRKYTIVRLVYYEVADTMEVAIRREKQLKRYRREWKRNLIERQNPAWNDLAVGLGLDPLMALPSPTLDPGTSPG
ncbi:GIY-YIG nuclease family protein [Sphingomonas sp.]|uniref:GIY-YIG nuclease family protein n=1 Tax=Sphingomonas sp. TaxID=28214 RepID=UPI0035BC5F77